VGFIFVTLLLDVIAFGLVIPVLPRLIESMEGGDTAQAARIYGAFGTVWALMQFLASPVIGSLSDRFGRRPVLLLSMAGLGLDYVLMALAPTVGWLLVGRVLNGLTAASFSTASAYIADVTPTEKRAGAFGLIGAAFGIGFVLGPALGGLLGEIGPRVPFAVAAACCLANTAWGLFVLPESLPPERRTALAWSRANPVGSLGLYRSRSALLPMAAIHTLFHLAHHVLPSCFVLYASFRYGWTERDVGLTLGLVGIGSIIVQGALVRRVVASLGEPATMVLGLLCGVAGFPGYGLAPTGTWFVLAVPVFAGMGLFGPALNARMSAQLDPGDQGKLQGANSSLMGLTGMVGPALFMQSLAWGIGLGLPGLPFLLATAFLGVALLGSLALRSAAPSQA
jgi:DHA1 family tetracycline resistance protein-like MFS transporter